MDLVILVLVAFFVAYKASYSGSGIMPAKITELEREVAQNMSQIDHKDAFMEVAYGLGFNNPTH